jgi:PAS domain S-box-containing protein
MKSSSTMNASKTASARQAVADTMTRPHEDRFPSASAGPTPQSAPSPLRILILEDTATDAELEEYALRKGGLTFVSFLVRTESALTAALEEFLPDLVICDYALPGFNGLQAIGIIRRHSADLPVILVTGVLDDDAAVEIIKSGITDYVLKDRLARLPIAVTNALDKVKAIRHRKRAEMARDALARVLECAEDGIISKDRNGAIAAWNGGAANIYGRMASEAIGRPIGEVLGAGFTKTLEQQLRQVEVSGEVAHVDTRYQRADGCRLWLSLVLSPIRDAAGGITGASIIVRDITERKRTERQLKTTADRLAESVRHAFEANLALEHEIGIRPEGRSRGSGCQTAGGKRELRQIVICGPREP